MDVGGGVEGAGAPVRGAALPALSRGGPGSGAAPTAAQGVRAARAYRTARSAVCPTAPPANSGFPRPGDTPPRTPRQRRP
ncbi:hypothetical protein GCM10009551_052850 [Nocardiopsis tropica]